MRDDSWIDGEPTDPRRRPVLLVALVLPWMLVAALIMLSGAPAVNSTAAGTEATRPSDEPVESTPAGGGPTPPSPAGNGNRTPGGVPAEPGNDPGVANPPASHERESAQAGLTITELRGAWRIEPGLEEVGALAVVIARAALTGVEPTLDLGVGSAPAGYAEHLVLESVEHSAPHAAVATVIAVVLDGDPLTASVRRLAVPISLADGIRPGGEPWELPPPELGRHDPPLLPWGGPEDRLEASEALARAGIEFEELVGLRSASGWPVVAEIRVAGDNEARRVWLRQHVDRLVVAGSTLADAREDAGGRDVTPPGPEERR